jgi:integrase
MFTLGSDIPCWWPRLARSAALGLYLWLVVVTGVRRCELCGLQIRDIDLDRGLVHVAFNYVVRRGQRVRKDTKTHQDRWLAMTRTPAH